MTILRELMKSLLESVTLIVIASMQINLDDKYVFKRICATFSSQRSNN